MSRDEQGAGEVNRIERSQWFGGEASARAIHDFAVDPQQVPVRSSLIQQCSGACGFSRCHLTGHDTSDEGAITFEEGEIRGCDRLRGRQGVARERTRWLSQEPGEYPARLGVNDQRSARTASRSRLARPDFELRRRVG